MSFNYLETPYYEISELKDSRIRINDKFQDFASLENYLYITIDDWNRNYPLPPLPNNIIVLELKCKYKFPLNNLPSSIEVLLIHSEYEFPLENLPINLYLLEFDSFSIVEYIYTKSLNFIPESVKILKIRYAINQSSYNLPTGLKKLDFSNNTFNDVIVFYPQELEYLEMQVHLSDHSRAPCQENSEKLEQYFNLINIPISIRTLYLPNCKISNLEIILKRLIHLETLYIPDNFNQIILEYPPNLVNLYICNICKFINLLINLPSSLKYISINCYNDSLSLEAIANSNVEYIDLNENQNLSIINYLPKSLKKLSIIETHIELYQIYKQYPHLEIDKIPDYDEREIIIDSMRGNLWW